MHTDVGMLAKRKNLHANIDNDVMFSGGFSQPSDVVNLGTLSKRLPKLQSVIIGKAIYEKHRSAGATLTAAGSFLSLRKYGRSQNL